jgi:hypothetical protein
MYATALLVMHDPDTNVTGTHNQDAIHETHISVVTESRTQEECPGTYTFFYTILKILKTF